IDDSGDRAYRGTMGIQARHGGAATRGCASRFSAGRRPRGRTRQPECMRRIGMMIGVDEGAEVRGRGICLLNAPDQQTKRTSTTSLDGAQFVVTAVEIERSL